jgi:hypothetical protein
LYLSPFPKSDDWVFFAGRRAPYLPGEAIESEDDDDSGRPSRNALKEGLCHIDSIEFIHGVAQQSNFHDFPLARMPMIPEIEIA